MEFRFLNILMPNIKFVLSTCYIYLTTNNITILEQIAKTAKNFIANSRCSTGLVVDWRLRQIYAVPLSFLDFPILRACQFRIVLISAYIHRSIQYVS